MSDLEIHQKLQSALDTFKDPETGKPVSKTGQVTDWVVTDGLARCRLSLTSLVAPIAIEIADRLKDHLMARVPGLKQVDVTLESLYRPAAALGQVGLRAKAVIAVAAGKGGVGKSTLAASMALTLERMGAKVGLVDADVYGPSIPHMLGLEGRPAVEDGKIQPIMCGTLPVMSMGFLIERNQAVVWRGPMLNGAITQFIRDTNWGELDYLIIDMPPGTGDVALTLSQLLPLTGAVIVCTPQEVALLDAGKAIGMFEKTSVPILGIVENMSGFTDPESGKTFDIFGRGGARSKAEEIGAPFLGEVPIQIALRSESDEGALAAALSDPRLAKPFEDVCRALVRSVTDRLASRPAAAASLPVLG
jgi:ATP-binding protein involved in chromosome partitioning